MFTFYDINGDGLVSIDEFMRGLREPLTERRMNLVTKAFMILDTNENGTITVDDIREMYDVSCHKDFMEGKKTKDQIIEEYLEGFTGLSSNNDG